MVQSLHEQSRINKVVPGLSKNTSKTSAYITFHDNSLLPLLFGEHDRTLSRVEDEFSVGISSRGNQVSISGGAENVKLAETVLNEIYQMLKNGIDMDESKVDATIRLLRSQKKKSGKGKAGSGSAKTPFWKDVVLTTPKKNVVPFSQTQADYVNAILNKDLTFASGPAGTGKTYFAVVTAAHLFVRSQVDRIILSRPAVEAGEKLGFLPGDLKEKVDPYLRPLYDALHEVMPSEKVQKHIASGDIEIAPLAFMRGRTLKHAFIILDEAQNVTPTQMMMFLTRMGEGSKMVINGDLSQTDLPYGQESGLSDAMKRLRKIKEIAFVEFQKSDIVRHHLTAKIIQAYEK